jgi:hypothetical protein
MHGGRSGSSGDGGIGTLQFIGTATTVLRLGSFTLLTDPTRGGGPPQ